MTVNSLKIHIYSFGFKYGLPPKSDFQFDVRFLPNPYWVEELRLTTGLEEATSSYVIDTPSARDFFMHIIPLFDFLCHQFTEADREIMTIGIGCTGGRHRSVAVAEKLGKLIAKLNHSATVTHQHINKKPTPVEPAF